MLVGSIAIVWVLREVFTYLKSRDALTKQEQRIATAEATVLGEVKYICESLGRNIERQTALMGEFVTEMKLLRAEQANMRKDLDELSDEVRRRSSPTPG